MALLKETNMAAVFQNRAAKYGDKACVAYKHNGEYTDISWNEMNSMVRNLAGYLLSIGIKKGDRIGLFSHNCYEWWVADLAILSIGAVNVPIYATNSAEEAHYVLANSEAKACFAGLSEHLNKVLQVKRKLPKLKHLVIFDNYSKRSKSVVDLVSAFKKGDAYKKKADFDKRLKNIKGADLATLIYTSGTTGDPKGVMLTHDNFLSDVVNTLKNFKGYIDDTFVFLSFLPLSHALERTAGEYISIYLGMKTAFAENLNTLMEDFQLVRPTAIISVPRIYEKVHTGILAKVEDASIIKKAVFNWAMRVARKNLAYVCDNKKRTGLFAKTFNIADKIIFSKLKAALGMDKMQFAISGGGPLSVADAEFFIGMGLKILEGYGLTETSPITNVNLPYAIKTGTVGPAVPGTKIKISDEGEILIKGPQVMKGYYKNPKATSEVMTKDGYFKTGDLGLIDEDGYLAITGRIKDIIITAGGKNISPQNIENSLKASPYIGQIAVIGDNKKFLSALIVPAFEELDKWAKRQGISAKSHSELIQQDAVVALYEKEIEKNMSNFAKVEQIRKFTLLDAEWSQDSGELTPTQKVKRRVIDEKYAAEIDSMYMS